MQGVLAINSNQFANSRFKSGMTIQRKELVKRLQNIESSLKTGDLELGLGTIRDLISGLFPHENTRPAAVKEGEANAKSKAEQGLHVINEPNLPVRVYTMGRFSVVIDGKPLVFRSKAQKRPIDLLKAVISLGGRGVAKSQLTDLLWPDSNGDASISVINTTLSRLRKLIGKEAIHTENGCISLNPDYCWVDCWELERLLNAGKDPECISKNVVSEIIKLYPGNYLAGEDNGWVVIRREKFRNKLLHTLRRYGLWLLHAGEVGAACEIFEKCLAVDELNEEFYMHLMQCQILLQQHSEAVITYRRCHRTLATFLGIAPSPECQKLYLSVVTVT